MPRHKKPYAGKAYAEKRPQCRPLRDRHDVRKPRSKDIRTMWAWDNNRHKKASTMSNYRYGYRLAWKVPEARDLLASKGFKKPKTYPVNQQGGEMFAMPYDIPNDFGEEDAAWVLRHCFDAGLTKAQLQGVSAMLSYAYQLQHGKAKGNYQAVTDQWEHQYEDEYAPPTKECKAKLSVEPAGLATAFTTEWTPDCGMVFMEWVVALLFVWDWCVLGMRSTEDIGKIKATDEREYRPGKTEKHVFRPSEGWMSTDLLGGRSKLHGKKGRRTWKAYRVCLCKNGVHKHAPQGWDHRLDSKGNPKTVTWATTCPLNCFQVVRTMLPQGDLKIYPRWLDKQGRYSKANIGEDKLIDLGRKWLDIQGANPDAIRFDNNSGRKALGKWCDEYGIPYRQSFEIHGDLWSTWQKYYQRTLKKDPGFDDREQSEDPATVTTALRRFARAIGRGRTIRDDPKEFTIDQIGQMLAFNLRKNGEGAALAKILDR